MDGFEVEIKSRHRSEGMILRQMSADQLKENEDRSALDGVFMYAHLPGNPLVFFDEDGVKELVRRLQRFLECGSIDPRLDDDVNKEARKRSSLKGGG